MVYPVQRVPVMVHDHGCDLRGKLTLIMYELGVGQFLDDARKILERRLRILGICSSSSTKCTDYAVPLRRMKIESIRAYVYPKASKEYFVP